MSNPDKIKLLLARTAERKAAGIATGIGNDTISVSPRKTARVPELAPCRHLGQPTGQTRPCQGCGGKTVDVPLRLCSVHGICTETKLVTLGDGTPVRCCNAMCREREVTTTG